MIFKLKPSRGQRPAPKSSRMSDQEQHHDCSILHKVATTTNAYQFLIQNRAYLLGLSRNSDWKNVVKCCTILTQIFQDSNNNCYLLEEEEELLTSSSRQQLVETDERGNTPLHVACQKNASAAVVHALFQAASHANATQVGDITMPSLQVHTRRNHQGATPLLVACKKGARHSVIQVLLLHSVDASYNINAGLLLPGGATVALQDTSGCTPIVSLVNRYEMNGMYSLKQEDQEDTTINNSTTTSKLLQATTTSTTTSIRLSFSSPTATRNSTTTTTTEGEDDRMKPLELIQEMLEAAWKDTSCSHARSLRSNNKIETISPLYAAAYMAETLPKSFTDWCFSKYAADASNLQHHHGDMLLPLHLAVSRPRPQKPDARRGEHRQAYFIQQLLKANPSTAQTFIPNNSTSSFSASRWVFHQAVASGMTWHSYNNEGCDELFSSGADGPLQWLFELHPEALIQRDCQTCLYPFQLAAACASTSTGSLEVDGCQNAEQDTSNSTSTMEQLDTIYNLLRLSPEVLIQAY